MATITQVQRGDGPYTAWSWVVRDDAGKQIAKVWRWHSGPYNVVMNGMRYRTKLTDLDAIVAAIERRREESR